MLVNEPDYDSIIATMTSDGTRPPEVKTSDAAVRATLLGVPSVRPSAEIYAYGLTRQIYDELR